MFTETTINNHPKKWPQETFENGSRGFVRRSASLSAFKPGQRLGWLREKAGQKKNRHSRRLVLRMVKQLGIYIPGTVHDPEYIDYIAAAVYRIENNITID